MSHNPIAHGEYRGRKLDAGTCIYCTKPARPGLVACAGCADDARRRYIARRGPGPRATRRCGECRSPDHTLPRCPVKP